MSHSFQGHLKGGESILSLPELLKRLVLQVPGGTIDLCCNNKSITKRQAIHIASFALNWTKVLQREVTYNNISAVSN